MNCLNEIPIFVLVVFPEYLLCRLLMPEQFAPIRFCVKKWYAQVKQVVTQIKEDLLNGVNVDFAFSC